MISFKALPSKTLIVFQKRILTGIVQLTSVKDDTPEQGGHASRGLVTRIVPLDDYRLGLCRERDETWSPNAWMRVSAPLNFSIQPASRLKVQDATYPTDRHPAVHREHHGQAAHQAGERTGERRFSQVRVVLHGNPQRWPGQSDHMQHLQQLRPPEGLCCAKRHEVASWRRLVRSGVVIRKIGSEHYSCPSPISRNIRCDKWETRSIKITSDMEVILIMTDSLRCEFVFATEKGWLISCGKR